MEVFAVDKHSRFWSRLATAVLLLLIVVAGAVIARKWIGLQWQYGKQAWLTRVERFTGEALDRQQVAKYGTHLDRPALPEGCTARAQFKTRLEPVGDYCITSATSGDTMWGFSLAVLNLDELWLISATSPLPGVSPSVAGCNGTASIELIDVKGGSYAGGPPPTWSVAQQAAWTLWMAGNPSGYSVYLGFLLEANVHCGGVGGADDSIYKVVGYGDPGPAHPDDPNVWLGDTEWILAGTISVKNLRLRMNLDQDTSTRYTVPRRWDDRFSDMAWFTETDPANPTTTVVTLGSMSVEYAVDLTPDPVTGKVDFTAGGLNPAYLVSNLVHGPGNANQQLNKSYCEVQNITCSSDLVAPNCYCSFWSVLGSPDAPEDWTVSLDPPANPIWHAFNVGNTLKLHAVGTPNSAPAAAGFATQARGPIRFNMFAGRGGHGEDFPVAAGWRCDMGLVRYINETETETVWVYEGLSDWYVWGFTSKAVDGAARLKTGTIEFDEIGGDVDNAWLVANGELLELSAVGGEVVPTIGNRRVKLVLPSLLDPLTGGYWGPVISLVWAEISANIPPGETVPPSLWTAGTGATVAGTYGERWTITGATAKITRALLSRYDARLDYLATGYNVGDMIYQAAWIYIARANFWFDADPPVVAAACAVEDVTDYDNSRCLILTFENNYPTGLPNDWQASAVLTLSYSTYTLSRACYTPAQYGGINIDFGVDGFFDYEKTDRTVAITGRKLTSADTTSALVFDLGQLRRGMGIDLRHVTQVELTLPTGEFRLADMRLGEDPDKHGTADADYPEFVAQPATDPWDWLTCGMGFGATFEGVPCLNIPEGTEATPFNGDVQLGIKQTQYWQYNPDWLADQEEAPTPADPSAARDLNVTMVTMLQRQEQLTGTTLGAAVGPATTDVDQNSLGYISLNGAIHVRSITPHAFLAPTVITGVWITHGRAHGMAWQSGDFVRGDGISSDGTGGMAVFYRRPVDVDGIPTGPWEVAGSFSPDVTGRWKSPPGKEGGYLYGTKSSLSLDIPDYTGSFVTREYQWFVMGFGGIPNLAITHHPVSGALLVTDAGLAADGSVGHHKIQRK
jgi:hypothetical protein